MAEDSDTLFHEDVIDVGAQQVSVSDPPPMPEPPPAPQQRQQPNTRTGSATARSGVSRTPIQANFKVDLDADTVGEMLSGPQNQNSNRPSQTRFATHGRDQVASKWLDENSENVAYAEHYLVVRRKTPVALAGVIVSGDRKHPIVPMKELVTTVQETSGGGNYRYDVYSPEHVISLTGNFSIPVNDYPARPLESKASSPVGPAPIVDAPEVAEAKRRLELMKLEKQIEEVQRKGEREDERKREGEMRASEDLQKQLITMQKESREEMRRLMEAQAAAQKDMMMMMMASVKEVVSATSRKDDGGAAGYNVIAEALKSTAAQQQNFMQLMVEQTKASKGDMAEATKAAAENSKHIVEMTVNNVRQMAEFQKGSGDKMQELVLSMLSKEANRQPMKEVMELMRQGEDRAADKYELIMDVMRDRDQPRADPNADPMNNIIALLANKFMGGGGGAPAGMASASPRRNMSSEEINEFARQLAPAVQAHMQYQQSQPMDGMPALPPPPQQAGVPSAPATIQPQQMAPHDLFHGGDDDDDDFPAIQSMPNAAAFQQQAPQQASAPAQQQAQPQWRTREEGIAAIGEDEYTKRVCTQVVAWAIMDTQSKALKSSWIESALHWMPDSFKRVFAEQQDVAHRALVLQQKADGQAFEALTKATTPDSYKVFTEGLQTLGDMIKAQMGQ
jgi:hypothetical protein